MSFYDIEEMEKIFVGRKVRRVGLNLGKDLLVLELYDSSPVLLSAYGDCCSLSWFEHINGTIFLEGAVIQSVEGVYMSHKDAGPDQDKDECNYIKVYGYKIRTDKGIFEIEMRNSSNGYYGGNIEVYQKDGNSSTGWRSTTFDDKIRDETFKDLEDY